MSMDTIWKFPIKITDSQVVVTRDAKIGRVIHAGLDPLGQPCIWCEVDTSYFDASESPRGGVEVFIVGTGNPSGWVARAEAHHISSFIQGAFVWHVYARKSA